tara:strand:+ start:271 stop:663 length:393 start_codon:yes stop_codon:yes gene_type:complete
VAKGATYRAAALSAGVSESAFYDWLSRGRKESSGIYQEFLESLNAASASVEARISERLVDISLGDGAQLDGKIALEYLRRRRPEDWNIPVQQQLTGAQGGSLKFIVDLGDSGTAQTGEAASETPSEVTSE